MSNEKPKNIYQRILDVQKDVKYVQKDKAVNVPGQGSYKAVTHDMVVSVARESLIANGVIIYPEQLDSEMLITRDVKSDIKMHLYSGKYNINFVNSDDPNDRIIVPINAHAADNGDKAPGKAITYATKTAILKVLNLETGEDEESRAEKAEKIKTINDNQEDMLVDLIEGDQKLWLNLQKAYNITHLNQIQSVKFEEVKKRISDYKDKKKNANN